MGFPTLYEGFMQACAIYAAEREREVYERTLAEIEADKEERRRNPGK